MPMNPRLLRPLARLQAPPPPCTYPASLLLHFDGGFTDSSENALTVTAEGTAAISTSVSKFGSGSCYFGGGATVAFPANGNVSGDGAFTVEMFLLPLAPPFPGETDYEILCATDEYNGFASVVNTDGTVTWGRSLIETVGTTTNAVTFDEWNHIAWVREYGVMKIFINGVLGYSDSCPDEFPAGVGRLGADGFGLSGSGLFLNGYVDDFRITKGLAVYTGPFIPPTGPLSACATPVPVSREASLLLHFDGADESTVFTDSSANSLTVTANGDAQISTAESKFGGASLYLDGSSTATADYDSAFAFYGDFTVEFWIRFSSHGDYGGMAACCSPSDEPVGWQVIFNGYSDNILIEMSDGVSFVSDSSLTPNTWQHVAVVKSGTAVTLYIDGVAAGSSPSTSSVDSGDQPLRIGQERGGYATMAGYIDDFRIVKGLAVYTGPFIPPTAPLSACATPTPPLPTVDVDYLLVAGGGAGGTWCGGGGGAGGLLTGTTAIAQGVPHTITVGAGAAETLVNGNGANGSDSEAFGLTAVGGGGGGGYPGTDDAVFENGGSGGGANGGGAAAGPGGSGVSGQGNDGGASDSLGSGGGGGAGDVGGDADYDTGTGGDGGAGIESSITGTALYYGGGGGGWSQQELTSPTGGAGGGGDGSTEAGTGGSTMEGTMTPTAGAANTGGGGGAGWYEFFENFGAAGGSGIVVIRSAVAAVATTGSPTVTTDDGDTIYTFTGSGSITF